MKISSYASVAARLAAALVIICSTAIADHHAGLDKPSFSFKQRQAVTAQVTSIDHETRAVTLKKADGEIVSITASEDVKNLDQAGVGDIVNAEFVESTTIQVISDDGSEPGKAGVTTMERSDTGEMPALEVVDTEITKAIVEEINLDNNTFKLRGPGGTIQQYTARNPGNLQRAAVGDVVVITVSRAVTIAVTKTN